MKKCIYLVILTYIFATITYGKMPTHLLISNYPALAYTTYRGSAILPINLFQIVEDEIILPVDVVFDSTFSNSEMGNSHFFLPVMRSSAYLTNEYTMKVTLPNGRILWFTRANTADNTYNMLALRKLNPIYTELQAKVIGGNIEIFSNDGWNLNYKKGKLYSIKKGQNKLTFKYTKKGLQIRNKNEKILNIVYDDASTFIYTKDDNFEFRYYTSANSEILKNGKCIASFEIKDESARQKLVYKLENMNTAFLIWDKSSGIILNDSFSSYSIQKNQIQRTYNNGTIVTYQYTPENEFTFKISSGNREVLFTEYIPAYGRVPKYMKYPNPFHSNVENRFFYSQTGNLDEKEEHEGESRYHYKYTHDNRTIISKDED